MRKNKTTPLLLAGDLTQAGKTMPPLDPAFKEFKWSINVEIETSSGEVLPLAYYRYGAGVWSVNASRRDIPFKDVVAWRRIRP